MKTGSIDISTLSDMDLIDVTSRVEKVLSESGIMEGAVTLFVPHTTAGITINENADPDVRRDLKEYFSKMLPPGIQFKHGEGNSHAHILSTLVSASITIPVTGGRLLLGTWQGIYFAEFDGPRKRRLYVNIRKD